MDPKQLRYAQSHEWAFLDGDVCTVGVTKFAVEQLTDLTYIELPDVGESVFKEDSFGEIESVKAVSDLYSPINGEIIEVNTAVGEDPSIVTNDPFGEGWMIKIKIEEGANLDHLMSLEKYEEQIAKEG